MGMDVVGRHPSSEAGEYFGANLWSWGPIHALIAELCSDLLDEETLQSLGFNEGGGPADQRTCTEMANRFERWLEHHTEGHEVDVEGVRVTPEGRFVTEEDPGQETVSPYQVDDELLKEWVEFLRHCGGFQVW